MKLLVFGATGQVSRELAAFEGTVCLPRSAVDLTDPDACAQAIRDCDADAVINAAAYTAVDKAEEETALAQQVNGDAPGAMAQAAAEKGVPFVHLSTDYVFDGSGARPWKPEDPTGPLGAYGRSKLAGEIGVRAAGGVHAIVRTSWVFSAHGANFVKTMLRLGTTRDRLTVVADQIGGPTSARAIAEACVTVAKGLVDNPQTVGTYHFSGAPDISWAGFAREVFARAGVKVDVADIPASEYPTPARRPMNSRMDCGSLQAAFGIERPDWRADLDLVLAELGAKEQGTDRA